MRCWVLLSLFVCVMIIPSLVSAEEVVLENDHISLTFEIDNDLFIKSTENKNTGSLFNFVENKPLWELWLSNITDWKNIYINSLTHSYTFNYYIQEYSNHKTLFVTWSDIEIDSNNKIDNVIATVVLGNNNDYAEFSINVETTLVDYSLYTVTFPEIYIEQIGSDSVDDFLAYPFHGGYIMNDPINRILMGWTHPAYWAMQFFSYYDDSGQLYLSTDDVEGYIKAYSIVGDNNTNSLIFKIDNIPENNNKPETDYSMPYNLILRPTNGDWFDASKYYRDWALGKIVTRGPMATSEDFPEPLLDADVASSYSLEGYSNNELDFTQAVIDGMKDSKDFYGIDRVLYVLYLWVNEPGLGAAPWPSVSLKPLVKSGIQAVHDAGDYIFPYTILFIDNESAFYKENSQVIDDNSIRKIDGSLLYYNDIVFHNSSDYTQILDPYTSYTQEHTKDFSLNLTQELDADGIYWDMWSGVNFLDYGDHGHPTGGGSYYTQGQKFQAEKTKTEIKKLQGKKEFFLGSEYINEFLVEYEEIGMWNPDKWGSVGKELIRIPMYESVYGDRQIIWNLAQTIAINAPGLDNMFSYVYASRLTIGEMLGYHGNSEVPFEPGSSTHGQESFDFLATMIKRTSADIVKEHVYWGEIQRNVQVNSVDSIDYYVMFENAFGASPVGFKNHYIYTPSYPEISYIMPSVWKSPNGTIALILVNWWESEQTIDYTFKFSDYGLSTSNDYSLTEINETGTFLIETVNNDFTRKETLSKRSIKVLMITTASLCKPGDTQLCPNQEGVCSGSFQTCNTNSAWPGCGSSEYEAMSDYEETESLCDNLDNDCDTFVDGDDSDTDNDSDGYSYCDNDCNDNDPDINPGESEDCDTNSDDNCNGEVNEDCSNNNNNGKDCSTGNEQQCVKGSCTGTQKCINGYWGACVCDQTNDPEICDGLDNNNNGLIDDGINCGCLTGEVKDCGSNIGECKHGKRTCDSGNWGLCQNNIGPVKEICDGLDNDCDSEIDEGCGVSSETCQNNLWDENEAGVDCGGVCANECPANNLWIYILAIASIFMIIGGIFVYTSMGPSSAPSTK